MRKEINKSWHPFETDLADFYSEPDKQVHSRVKFKEGTIHIYYYIKPEYTLITISDKWLSEILDYLIQKGYTCEEIVLHYRKTDFTT